MIRYLFSIVLVLAMGAAFAYHIHPDAKPGPEPGVRQFTEAELEAQQSQTVAVPEPTYLADTAEKTEPPDVPLDAGQQATLGAGKSRQVDGVQVLRSVDRDMRQGKRGLWRAALGFLLCSCVGFGGIAYVRNWADKNAPDPAKMRAAQTLRASRPRTG